MLKKNVVIFGGTGFIGREILYELSASGYNTKVFVQRPERHRDLLLIKNTKIEHWSASDDYCIIDKQLEGTSIVINLTTDPFFTTETIPLKKIARVNRRIKKAIEYNNIERVITLSQIGANVNQSSDKWRQTLGEVEALMHILVKANNTTIRAGLLIGKGDTVTSYYKKHLDYFTSLPIIYSQNIVQPLGIKDFSKALVSIIDDSKTYGKKISVAGETVLTLSELGLLVAKLMGKEQVKIRNLPKFIAKLIITLGHLSPIKSVSKSQLFMLKYSLISKIRFKDLFGFKPNCLEKTLSSYIMPKARSHYNTWRTQMSSRENK